MRAKVKQETGREKDRWSTARLFAGERCSEAILEFLRRRMWGRRSRVRQRSRGARYQRSLAQQVSVCGDRLNGVLPFISFSLLHSLIGSGAASDRPAAGPSTAAGRGGQERTVQVRHSLDRLHAK